MRVSNGTMTGNKNVDEKRFSEFTPATSHRRCFTCTAGTGNSRLATKTIQECSFCAQLRLEAHTRRENSQQSRDAPQLFLPILFILRNSFGIFGIRLLGFERGEFWDFWDFIWDSNRGCRSALQTLKKSPPLLKNHPCCFQKSPPLSLKITGKSAKKITPSP